MELVCVMFCFCIKLYLYACLLFLCFEFFSSDFCCGSKNEKFQRDSCILPRIYCKCQIYKRLILYISLPLLVGVWGEQINPLYPFCFSFFNCKNQLLLNIAGITIF